MPKSFLFTSEAVSEGHPDKVCDQISDAVLDAVLAQDARGHVACETLATTNYVALAGEVSFQGEAPDYEGLVRQTVSEIGYDRPGEGFQAATLRVENRLHKQSADIARGVSEATSITGEQGAGDQGIMFGYACDETPAYMPAPIYYAKKILRRLSQLRRSQPEYDFLRPDAKSQLTFRYEEGRPVAITSLVVSHQHLEGTGEKVRQAVLDVLRETLPQELLQEVDLSRVNQRGGQLYINPTGNFVIGGPDGDTGVTGRKIIVDTYGGAGRHGGGAFSGKDPSKVDRSACYMLRRIAKNLVAAGAARRCELQVAYAIGVTDPLAFNVNFFGTGAVPEKKVVRLLQERRIFDCRPAQISQELGLLSPRGWSYRESAAYGPFGWEEFPWERLDQVEALKDALGL
ncbi:MAG: methionine adenosyltransferase [Oligosphaeraceae bacterium]